MDPPLQTRSCLVRGNKVDGGVGREDAEVVATELEGRKCEIVSYLYPANFSYEKHTQKNGIQRKPVKVSIKGKKFQD